MNAIKDDIPKLVDKELTAANKVFPPFVSVHEAYAVIKEEKEELEEAAEGVNRYHELMWSQIRNNRPSDEIEHTLVGLRGKAMEAAIEAIQTAAMADKALMSFGLEKYNPALLEAEIEELVEDILNL